MGPTDQRSQIRTFNVAPSWTHLIGSNTVFTVGAFVRHDQYNYYPSNNPFADLGPPSLQRETVSQLRFLTNAGARASVSYVKGINNIKAGVTYEQTVLTENDKLGIVDPTFNAPCLATAQPACSCGVPVAGFTDPFECAAWIPAETFVRTQFAAQLNLGVLSQLRSHTGCPFDLTRGGLRLPRPHRRERDRALRGGHDYEGKLVV